jgi:ribosomal protein L37AE/L43A
VGVNDHNENERLLKPCPFCGNKAYRKIENSILTVGCEYCGIQFHNHVRYGCVADGKWDTRSLTQQN